MDHEISVCPNDKTIKTSYKGDDKKLNDLLDDTAKKKGGKKTKEDRKFGWTEKEYKFSNGKEAADTASEHEKTIHKWDK